MMLVSPETGDCNFHQWQCLPDREGRANERQLPRCRAGQQAAMIPATVSHILGQFSTQNFSLAIQAGKTTV